jgi:hypothetical protein
MPNDDAETQAEKLIDLRVPVTSDDEAMRGYKEARLAKIIQLAKAATTADELRELADVYKPLHSTGANELNQLERQARSVLYSRATELMKDAKTAADIRALDEITKLIGNSGIPMIDPLDRFTTESDLPFSQGRRSGGTSKSGPGAP